MAAQGATTGSEKAAAISQLAGDPAFAAAKETIPLVTAFHEFLGGEKGPIDWEKFVGPDDQSDKPSGISYLSATLNAQKSKVDATGTEANNKLLSAYSSLIKVQSAVILAYTIFNTYYRSRTTLRNTRSLRQTSKQRISQTTRSGLGKRQSIRRRQTFSASLLRHRHWALSILQPLSSI